MYSRQQASELRQAFWTAFGQYMAPVLSAEGEKINWVNYKTGEKHLVFRMQAESRTASIAIELTHMDRGVRDLYFEQFVQLKAGLHETLGEEWEWLRQTCDPHGKELSVIRKELEPVSIFRREDWPELISFFKPRIRALDAFWSSSRYFFEALH